MAIPVGLLFWLNLMSRVVLLAASWSADDVDLATLTDEVGRTAQASAPRPPFLGALPATADTSTLPYAASPPSAQPVAQASASSQNTAGHASRGPIVSSPRAVDRVSVAAGVVVGAAGAGVVAALLRRRH